MIYYEKNKDNIKLKSRIEHFISYHQGMSELINQKCRPLVEYIYGQPMNLFKDKINWKYGGGKGFKAHQDHQWDDFEPDRFLSMALFANKTTIENGCLEFGTQKKNRTHFSVLNLNFQVLKKKVKIQRNICY